MRTVFLHELFPGREGVRDRELAPLVADTCPEEGARAWYYALLDYGAHLKTAGGEPVKRSSAHHTRQSRLRGVAAAEARRARAHRAGRPGHRRAGAGWSPGRLRAGRRPPRVDADVFDGIVADLVSEGFFRREGDLFFA